MEIAAMRQAILRFLSADNGATAIEYSLLAGLIAFVIVGAITLLGNKVSTTLYDQIAAAF